MELNKIIYYLESCNTSKKYKDRRITCRSGLEKSVVYSFMNLLDSIFDYEEISSNFEYNLTIGLISLRSYIKSKEIFNNIRYYYQITGENDKYLRLISNLKDINIYLQDLNEYNISVNTLVNNILKTIHFENSKMFYETSEISSYKFISNKNIRKLNLDNFYFIKTRNYRFILYVSNNLNKTIEKIVPSSENDSEMYNLIKLDNVNMFQKQYISISEVESKSNIKKLFRKVGSRDFESRLVFKDKSLSLNPTKKYYNTIKEKYNLSESDLKCPCCGNYKSFKTIQVSKDGLNYKQKLNLNRLVLSDTCKNQECIDKDFIEKVENILDNTNIKDSIKMTKSVVKKIEKIILNSTDDKDIFTLDGWRFIPYMRGDLVYYTRNQILGSYHSYYKFMINGNKIPKVKSVYYREINKFIKNQKETTDIIVKNIKLNTVVDFVDVNSKIIDKNEIARENIKKNLKTYKCESREYNNLTEKDIEDYRVFLTNRQVYLKNDIVMKDAMSNIKIDLFTNKLGIELRNYQTKDYEIENRYIKDKYSLGSFIKIENIVKKYNFKNYINDDMYNKCGEYDKDKKDKIMFKSSERRYYLADMVDEDMKVAIILDSNSRNGEKYGLSTDIISYITNGYSVVKINLDKNSNIFKKGYLGIYESYISDKMTLIRKSDIIKDIEIYESLGNTDLYKNTKKNKKNIDMMIEKIKNVSVQKVNLKYLEKYLESR